MQAGQSGPDRKYVRTQCNGRDFRACVSRLFQRPPSKQGKLRLGDFVRKDRRKVSGSGVGGQKGGAFLHLPIAL
jgi:hypothetical protein